MRRPDWSARLAGILEHAERTPFVWGKDDCCLFAADCVFAMTGRDPATFFRNTYTSPNGAWRRIKAYCGEMSVQLLLEQMARDQDWPATMVGRATAGDLVMTRISGHDLPGICIDGARVAVRSTGGFLKVDLITAGRLAWSVN